jgi:LmbE family N-acetylglucosaminyl deacetylase
MTQKNVWTVLLTLMCLLVPAARADQQPPLLAMSFSPATRLLVVAPHPDDETLGAGGLIQRVRHAGGAVKVVFMTSGDGFPAGVALARHIQHPQAQDYREYGRLRQEEAKQALATLGVSSKDVLFLGFPDSGLCPLQVTYLIDNGRNYLSPFTLEDRPPTADAMLPSIEYNGEDLTKELTWVLSHFRPTLVVTVHPMDRHPDHCATYRFVSAALQALPKYDAALRPSLLTFLVHFGNWWPMFGRESTEPQLHLPQHFPESEATWRSLPLSDVEMQTKRQALLQYHSQMLVMGRYLLSFIRTNELFAAEPQGMQEVSQQMLWPCCPREER